MWETLSHISALSVFLIIAGVGFLFLLITFLFGEIFEGLNFGHDIGHDIGHDGPGIFSARVLSVFATAFGGFAAIVTYQGYGLLASLLLGLVGGVALGAMIYYFARFLYNQQSSSMVTSADLIGRTAEVTVSIPADGFGQVRCLIGESMVDKIARSNDGTEIPYNSQVLIEEITGESVIVSRRPSLGEGRGLFR
jgi:hypothetical protein